MNRNEIQDKAVDLSKVYNEICLEFATGLGKSLAAIRIIETGQEKWGIAVAEISHIDNWKREFSKHNKEHLLKNITFFCYQSLHKYTNLDNYVFDETHHIFSDKRFALLKSIKPNKVIFLSATLTRTQKELLQELYKNLFIYKINISEAVKEGLLPKPQVFLVECELDNLSPIHKFVYSKDRFVMCTEQQYYDKLTERIEYLKNRYFESRLDHHRITWLSAGNNRKKFLAKCKTRYVRRLLNKLANKRLICFTNSIEQSESLSRGLSIHSKISKDNRAQLISDFNSGKINRLFATGMLREGMNLDNIEVGVIIQLDNIERTFSQAHGRVLRSSFPEQYILYCINTQDETYVNTSLENFDKSLITNIVIEDI